MHFKNHWFRCKIEIVNEKSDQCFRKIIMNRRDMKVSCVDFLRVLFFSLILFGLQDYPTYTILGQSQYQACYPSSSFGVTGQTNSDAESTTLAATTYQTEKPNVMVPASATQRLSSGKHCSSKNFGLRVLCSTSDGEDYFILV